jgi:hypothetical protein
VICWFQNFHDTLVGPYLALNYLGLRGSGPVVKLVMCIIPPLPTIAEFVFKCVTPACELSAFSICGWTIASFAIDFFGMGLLLFVG